MTEYLYRLNSKAADFLISYGAKKKVWSGHKVTFIAQFLVNFGKNNQCDRFCICIIMLTFIYSNFRKVSRQCFLFPSYSAHLLCLRDTICRPSVEPALFHLHNGPSRLVSLASPEEQYIKRVNKSIRLSLTWLFEQLCRFGGSWLPPLHSPS